jgi:hypothetical protein
MTFFKDGPDQRLFPTYHNYRLAGPACRELVQAATGRGLHVAVPLRLEDRRQRHWLDTTAEVSLADVADLARACPEAEFLVLEALGVENSAFVRDPSSRVGSPRRRRCCAEEGIRPGQEGFPRRSRCCSEEGVRPRGGCSTAGAGARLVPTGRAEIDALVGRYRTG